MHQNLFGCRGLSGPTGGAYSVTSDPLTEFTGRERPREGLVMREREKWRGGKGRKRKKIEGREKRGKGSIPAFLFIYFKPCVQKSRIS